MPAAAVADQYQSVPRSGRAPGRLRAAQDIGRVRREGASVTVGTVRVHALSRAAEPVRATAVAGRHVGTAVQRNRAKRLIREALRRVAFRQGHDLVVVARPSIVGADMHRVLSDLTRAATRLGVVQP